MTPSPALAQRSLLLSIVVATLLGCGPLSASAATSSKLAVGARIAAAFPSGSTEWQGVDLQKTQPLHLGAQLDAYYVPIPHFYIGGYAGLSRAFVSESYSNSCGSDDTPCTIRVMRLGMQAEWRILPRATFQPFLALGVGYERMRFRNKEAAKSESLTFSGMEVSTHVGVLAEIAPGVGLGPYLGASVGKYRHGSPSGISGSERSLHRWFTAGIRVAFLI